MDLTAIPLERLEAEIATQAAHIAAATCRWLELVAEFERREGYADWGCRSTAHWLNWRCGVSLVSGREQVRVGRRVSRAEVEEVHARRDVSWHVEDDGSFVLRARLSPEEGEVLLAALEATRRSLADDAELSTENDSAEASRPTNADALVAMAHTVSAH